MTIAVSIAMALAIVWFSIYTYKALEIRGEREQKRRSAMDGEERTVFRLILTPTTLVGETAWFGIRRVRQKMTLCHFSDGELHGWGWASWEWTDIGWAD